VKNPSDPGPTCAKPSCDWPYPASTLRAPPLGWSYEGASSRAAPAPARRPCVGAPEAAQELQAFVERLEERLSEATQRAKFLEDGSRLAVCDLGCWRHGKRRHPQAEGHADPTQTGMCAVLSQPWSRGTPAGWKEHVAAMRGLGLNLGLPAQAAPDQAEPAEAPRTPSPRTAELSRQASASPNGGWNACQERARWQGIRAKGFKGFCCLLYCAKLALLRSRGEVRFLYVLPLRRCTCLCMCAWSWT